MFACSLWRRDRGTGIKSPSAGVVYLVREGVVIVELGRIIAVNRTYAALVGRAPAEMIGRPALDFIAPAFRTLATQRVTQEQEGVYEAELLRADGTTVPVQVTGRRIRYQG